MLFRLNRGVPYAALAMGPQVFCAPLLGGGRMAKESSGPPLPRRVPGAADSPRPPAGIKPPPLPQSLIERLRAAAEIAKEEETPHAGEETAPPKREPPRGPTASPDEALPSPWRSPSRRDAPGADQDSEAAGE